MLFVRRKERKENRRKAVCVSSILYCYNKIMKQAKFVRTGHKASLMQFYIFKGMRASVSLLYGEDHMTDNRMVFSIVRLHSLTRSQKEILGSILKSRIEL